MKYIASYKQIEEISKSIKPLVQQLKTEDAVKSKKRQEIE
jgi:hypothetical protein